MELHAADEILPLDKLLLASQIYFIIPSGLDERQVTQPPAPLRNGSSGTRVSRDGVAGG